MTKEEIDRAIREIAAITRRVDGAEWELTDRLAQFSSVEYEQALPRLTEETGWTRQRLTTYYMTGRQWTPEKRLPDVPFVLHQRFRYQPEELVRQHDTGTLGQQTPARRRQVWTLTQMQAAITSILALVDEPTVADHEFRTKVAGILGLWRGAKAA
jgi:hypothetical protein